MNLQDLLKEIKKFSTSDLDVAEMEDSTIFVTKNFIQILSRSDAEPTVVGELILECIKHLKLMCSKGSSFQNLIVNTAQMIPSLLNVLLSGSKNVSRIHQLKTFQLVANICVQNQFSQGKIWGDLQDVIIARLEGDDKDFTNVAAMITYNMVLSELPDVDQLQIFKISLRHFSLATSANPLPDFIHILMDFMLCKSENCLELYKQLGPEDQKTALYYIQDYVEEETNDNINNALLHHLTTEFKLKSDCILKTVTTFVDSIDPQIVVVMLDIISTATSQEKYMKTLKDDRSLFLNLGCLLQALHKIGKNNDSIFTPIQKLEALVPTSTENGDFEKEFSYSFKTKLVKSLANLSHKNKRNQELAREMEIMQSIFECTNADARNPLIKEWSILAIRNLCEGNLENQEMVANLTKVGTAENPLLKEMGLESGMLRIGKQ